jgi:diguanylate cyclase (GGDEF)-like protein/PAS domain S-box-containing protein
VSDETFFKTLIDNLYDGVYFVDRQRRITYWNRAAERLSGYQQDEMEGEFCWNNRLQHVDEYGRLLCTGHCPLVATMVDGCAREAEVFMRHKAGYRIPVLVRVSPIHNDAGTIIGAVEIFSDNSHRAVATQEIEHLQRLALLDPLTNIGNRRYIEGEIYAQIESLRRYEWPFGVLMVDIDRFKQVNDTYGHLVGDDMLKMVTGTLENNIRTFDAIGRWGGEEFVIVVRNVSAELLASMAERLRMLVEQSFLMVAEGALSVTISIGGTLAKPTDTAETLLERADRLLYHSKAAGRNRVTMEATS